MIRLAYLSPEVLERLVIRRVTPALNDLVAVAELPWVEQGELVFATATTQGLGGSTLIAEDGHSRLLGMPAPL